MELRIHKALAPPIYGGANGIQSDIIGKSPALRPAIRDLWP
ncbi:MAG: hypothetical protein QOD39_1821 [Mycobacterium sp.]|jgi:hypothetical protein|nr:hypothetical protein [Mycobacterium sp.]